MVIHKHTIKASEEIMEPTETLVEEPEVVETPAEEPVVEVAPEATDLLFEAEDVAELIAEVTGQEVDVTVDEDKVVFAVGEDEFTVEAEGDEEIVETSTKVLGKTAIKAARKVARKA